jgi:predicted RNase H-like HicB family nuclease
MAAMKRRTYTAHCEREGGWWIVTVPELDGVFTHARRLDQVETLVRDAIALWLETEPDSFDVQVDPAIPTEAANAIVEAHRARHAATVAKAQAALSTTTAVVELFSTGMPTRDVGKLVGISHQRVAQILEEAGAGR